MCGRLKREKGARELVEEFREVGIVHYRLGDEMRQPHFNVAPTQLVPAIRSGAEGPEAVALRWGLIPSWSKDRTIASKTINARIEGIATKPSFRTALKRRRCAVVSDGFYEWRAVEGRKQPYLIKRPGGGALAMAGLWEAWNSPEGEAVETCTIITTAAAGPVEAIHSRMPVVLPSQRIAAWIDPSVTDADHALALLAGDPPEVEIVAVSTLLNNVRNTGPEVLVAEVDAHLPPAPFPPST